MGQSQGKEDLKEAQTMELLVKDITSIGLNMFNKLKETMDKN